MRHFEQETNANFMRLSNGSVVRKVSKKRYLLCEQIRNYVYRTNYELGISIEVASLKAQCLFDVDEKTVWRALHYWKNWYYEEGKRHRPIELFIEEDKKRIENEKYTLVKVIE